MIPPCEFGFLAKRFSKMNRPGASSANNSRSGLHLAKFAPTEVAQGESDRNAGEGPTEIIRRAATEKMEEVSGNFTDGDTEFGLSVARMAGIITYCYSKGVFCSKDIARLIAQEPSLRAIFGSDTPDEKAIRRFRRRYSETIEEILETFFGQHPGFGCSTDTAGAISPGDMAQRTATALLHEASRTDNSKGRLS
jgi:hypothetical protein